MTDLQKRKTTISWTIRAVLAFLFLLSAVAKLYPSPYFALTTFEIKQLLPMGFSETSAAYFSRLLIGCEFALGFLLLQRHYFRMLVLPVSFLLLFIFSAHLTYEIIATGNSGNCGCFGSLLPMTPLQAVIKNVIAMGLIGYLWKVTAKDYDRKNFPVLLSVTLGSMLLVFLVGPMRQKTTAAPAPVIENVVPEPTTQEPVVTEKDGKTEIPAADAKTTTTEQVEPEKAVVDEPKPKKSGFASLFPGIDKGKRTLCFFAPGCDHCRETAKELTQLAKQSKDFPPITIVFMDEEAELIPDFFAFAGAKYPYQVMEVGQFWQTIENRDTPAVYYLWNGNAIKVWDGINEKKFDIKTFKALIAKDFSKIK